MTPSSGGRHCAACDKVVVDFTAMSDAEVVAYLKQAAGKTCGRVRPDQLKTYALPENGFRIGIRPALAAIGLAMATVLVRPSEAHAQTKVPAAWQQENGTEAKQTATTLPLKITGQVIDKTDGTPLPGASVIVNATTGTYTDIEGTFSLNADGLKPGAKIEVMYLGFSVYEYRITEADLAKGTLKIIAYLEEEDYPLMGGLVVEYGGPTATKWSVDYWVSRAWANGRNVVRRWFL